MPKLTDIKKVLVIGSGPIIIGQAAEFDYAGTQACRALKEEGLEVVLVNSNPATIMTDVHIADRVYVEPINIEFLETIIKRERPDSLLATLGGQMGLNMAMELDKKGILKEYNVRLLGTQISAIKRGEDRELFKETMEKINQPIPESIIVETIEAAVDFGREIGYPLIVRPAYTLGGTGGGIAEDEETLCDIVQKGLGYSPIGQCLIERSIAGWKEIEFEVIRDAADNCITVCSMENVDPVGVHTGDSIVVAPAQTLNDKEVQLLRQASIDIVRELGVVGGCNVQLALDPYSENYYVIEVNPRVSRSSALASKATGYPIAKVTSKIAIGYNLDEIENAVTKTTKACFEPTIDYIVLKFPRWPFDKFVTADRSLGTQMKATGEVMAIERSFEASLLKAIRSLEIGLTHLEMPELKALSDEEIKERIHRVDDERIFVVAEAMRRGVTIEEIYSITKINQWFLYKIGNIIKMERALATHELTPSLLRKAKQTGFADSVIAGIVGKTEMEIRDLRKANGILPTYKMVDTCAAEFEAATPYYYSCYATEDEVVVSDKKKVVVLGSGPIRIGQGVEFDYCSVHCVWSLREMGYETIIINNNPETVSTDFDISDKLYFEPLTVEDVLNVIDKEQPEGVIVQFGGQTAINLAGPLNALGVKVLGSSVDSIDRAEDRERFEQLLTDCDIPRPKGHTVFDTEGALNAAHDVSYPVMVRPSYVLGGQGMRIAVSDEDVEEYIGVINQIAQEHPILVDKYLMGKEIEVDAVCDGEDILIPGIMEHIERAGIHSGDSISVYPAQSLDDHVKATIVDYTRKLAQSLHVIGLINIQFIVCGEDVYVIEVNPRSSRTVPYISKVTGIPIVPLATRVILGKKLKELGYPTGLAPEADYIAIKMPVFSFEKIRGADISLGPEMKSTGECLGIAKTFNEALYKAFIGAGIKLQKHKNMIMTLKDADKEEGIEIARRFEKIGYRIYATRGTAKVLQEAGVNAIRTNKIEQESPNLLDLILGHKIDLVIDTPSQGVEHSRDGFLIRRTAIETGVNVLTAMDTARALVTSLENTDIKKLTLIDIATVKNI